MRAPMSLPMTASTAPMSTMPTSERHTFCGHDAGHRLVLKGFTGTKWLEVPYLVRVRVRVRATAWARDRVGDRVKANG